MPKQRTREEAASYMREYRARKRQGAGAGSATAPGEAAAPFDLPDLAAIAEPPASDADVSAVTVRLTDAQFARLAALMRAVEARHGSKVTAPVAMRFALEVARRAIVAD